MAEWTSNLGYYFHETVNLLVNIAILLLLFLIAARILSNIASLMSIIIL
ncbi:MAG: hypothetical protein U9P14_07380 [Gemmatimonadota bacterium]|nr:hypothetical protein [Gemmatimonadota bacterium]